MIYISSACVNNKYIAQSVEQLANEGYRNIELSGGTQPYPEMEQDLLALKKRFNLNYLCHNYFPPPEKPFVINLASLDEEVSTLTINNLTKALNLTKSLNASAIGFHAGFLINIPVTQIGKSISSQDLFDRKEALKVFKERVRKLADEFPEIKLYVENNVLSSQNYKNFKLINPFFLCDSEGYKEMNAAFELNLLLDVAHLKVTSKTLNKSFEEELNFLIPKSEYIHISDNDGDSDSNQPFLIESEMYRLLKMHNFENKIVTIEVYGTLQDIKTSYNTAKSLINA